MTYTSYIHRSMDVSIITSVLFILMQFEDDISKIKGFTIIYGILNERSTILFQYQVTSFNRNTDIETDGRTYVRNILLLNFRDNARVSVSVTMNNIFHLRSEPAIIERCINQEISTTSMCTYMYGAKCTYVCMYRAKCTYVCTYRAKCTYVCMYVRMYVYTYVLDKFKNC